MAAAGLMIAALSPLTAWALPQGGTVSAGSAAISTPTFTTMRVDQYTDRAILDWRSFNIWTNESVRFQQPSAASIALNRVAGLEPSGIYGSLTANGQIFLINPSGILFGSSSRVDVAGLTATTLNITNQDFLVSRYNFMQVPGMPSAAVVNQGVITAGPGGYVALLGAAVRNEGLIQANLGSIALAAGKAATLDMRGDGLIEFVVTDAVSGGVTGPDEKSLTSYVSNTGTLQADGGMVTLTANAAVDIIKSVVNQEGVIRAQSMTERNGVVVFSGGPQGIVSVSGTIDTSGTQAGQTGGTVQVLGEKVGLFGGHINASGDAGGGTVLFGGDLHGLGTVQNAFRTYVSPDSTINSDAITNGSGGKVVVWSNDGTQFYGAITARGGAQGGDGGFVEVSGKQYLDFRGTVDTTAPMGKTGTLLLDPTEITITHDVAANTSVTIVCAGGGTCAVPLVPGPFSDTTPTTGTLTDGTINAQLGINNVTVTTSTNDIVISNATGTVTIAPSPGLSNANTLTLNSAANISWNAGWSYTNNGALTLKANGGSISGTGALTVNGTGGLELVANTTINATTGADTLAASAPNGITISNTAPSGTLTITTVGSTSGLTATNGAISLTEAGSIVVSQPVSAGTFFDLEAGSTGGSLSINADLTANTSGSTQTSTLLADTGFTGTGSITQNATSTITTNNGDVDIAIVCALGCGGGGGTGTGQDITLGAVNAGTGQVRIRTEFGGVVDANGAGTLNITANDLVIRSEQGIDLDTAVNRLNVRNAIKGGTGDVSIRNTNGGTLTLENFFFGSQSVQNTGGKITISNDGSIDVVTGTDSGTAQTTLQATAGSISGAGVLRAGSLELIAGTTISSTTATDSLAASGPGGVTISNTAPSGTLTVTTVGGTTGITAMANPISLTEAGSIVVSQPIDSGGAQITVTATVGSLSGVGTVGGTAGDSVALVAGTTITSTTGADSLAASAPNGITISNTAPSGTLAVDTVNGVVGITATANPISLTEAGSIVVNQKIDSGGAQITVTATAGSISGVGTIGGTAGDSVALVAGTTITSTTGADTLAASAPNGITISNTAPSGTLAVDIVGGTTGISTTDSPISLTEAGGDVTVNQNINAGASTVALTLQVADALLTNNATITGTGVGGVTLTADHLNLSSGLIDAGTDRVTLTPFTTAQTIDFGGVHETPGTLTLDSSDLSGIMAGTIQVGVTSNTGNITASADTAAPANTVLSVQTGGSGSITSTGGGLAADSLALQAGSGGINILTATTNLAAAATGGGITIGNNISLAPTPGATLTVTTVDGVVGINSTGTAISLSENTGNITVSAAIDSGAAQTTINAAGALSGAATITAGLLTTSSSGGTTLNNASNAVSSYSGTDSSGGAISFTDSKGFDVAAGGISTTGNVTLTATAGNLTMSQNIAAGTGNVTLTATGGTISETTGTISSALLTTSSVGGTTLNQANTVTSFHATNATSGNVQLTNTGALDITGVSQTGGNLVILTSGAITDSGALSVSGTSSFTSSGGGAITLDNASSYTGAVSLFTTNNATLTGVTTALNLGTSTVGGNLVASSVGAITNTGGALAVTGTSSFTTTGVNNSVTVNDAGNMLTGTVTLAPSGSGNATLVNNTATDLAGTTIGGTLSVTSNGGITQSGALLVTGTSSFSAGANPITLTNTSNDFTGAVSLTNTGANAVSITDTNALTLGTLSVGGDLTATSTGALNLGQGSVGGNLAATSNGFAISQAGALTITGTSNINAGAGNITLTNTSNDFQGAVTLSGGAIDVRDTNSLMVASLTNGANQPVSLLAGTTLTLPAQSIDTGTAALDLESQGGTLTTGGNLSGSNITLVGSGGLSLGHNVTAGGTLGLSTTNNLIAQTTGTVSATGVTTANAGTGAITLTQATNDFGGAVNLTGGATSITDANALTLGTLVTGNLTATSTGALNLGTGTVTGNLVATSNGGAISQAGALTVTGTTTLAAGANDITLGSVNDFTGAVSVTNGANVTLMDANNINIGSITATAGVTINAASINQPGGGGSITTPGAIILTGTPICTAPSPLLTTPSVTCNGHTCNAALMEFVNATLTLLVQQTSTSIGNKLSDIQAAILAALLTKQTGPSELLTSGILPEYIFKSLGSQVFEVVGGAAGFGKAEGGKPVCVKILESDKGEIFCQPEGIQ